MTLRQFCTRTYHDRVTAKSCGAASHPARRYVVGVVGSDQSSAHSQNVASTARFATRLFQPHLTARAVCESTCGWAVNATPPSPSARSNAGGRPPRRTSRGQLPVEVVLARRVQRDGVQRHGTASLVQRVHAVAPREDVGVGEVFLVQIEGVRGESSGAHRAEGASVDDGVGGFLGAKLGRGRTGT